jgi:hypothetical protein
MLQTFLFRAMSLLVTAAVHGLALSLVVRGLDDCGPVQHGRLTINPHTFTPLAALQ